MIISIIAITAIVKIRKNQRTGNQFFVIMVIFWSATFITSIRPEILDDIVEATGLFNKAQFLLILSIVIILYLLTLQLMKNKSITFNFHRIVRNSAISTFNQEIASYITEKLDLVIVIAAKNESKSIGDVIEKINLLNLPFSHKILVVNDGSTDNTAQIAKSKDALVVNHFQNLGLGGAIKTGYIASLFLKPEIVITTDAVQETIQCTHPCPK